jgi:hypothetical protein
MVENVFVVGLNDHSAAILSRLPDADRYRFHRLLSSDELLFRDTIPLPDLLAEAQRRVEAFDGPVHAVIGFWDFPVSTMVAMLCHRLGLRWASLESVAKCEHKYWSRLEQRRVIDEYPRFGLVDLDKPALPDGLRYPVWVKSVTSPTHGARCPPPLPDRATARHARCPAHTSRWMQRHDTGQRPLPRTL